VVAIEVVPVIKVGLTVSLAAVVSDKDSSEEPVWATDT
jgi:hypothetical protein